MERFAALIPLFLAVLPVEPALAMSRMDADLLLRNGHIVTMDSPQKFVTAMAVRNGKILALGNDEELASCASARTKVVDLQKRTVLPGLIDVHTHAMEWTKGMLRGQIEAGYPKVHAISEIAQEVGRRAAKLKPGEWIVGSGWDDSKLAEHRYITREDLDPIALNHPVYLVHVSGHLAAVSSAALKMAGITKQTPDPQGGVIERDKAGKPTGILKDTAMDLVDSLLPSDPPDLGVRAAKLVSEKASEVGLTTIHDIYLSAAGMNSYQDAYRRGWLKIRVQMSPRIGALPMRRSWHRWARTPVLATIT